MPGIYTHNYIFRKVVEQVSKNRGKSYLMKSIEILLSSADHLKAGLFGAIGPNIFDYIHLFSKNETYGSEISFYLHDGGYSSFIQRMIDVIMESWDSRNEWSSTHRAYLLGYLSHIISDSVLHPYVFYSSGFPDKNKPANSPFYRSRNLRFQYNLDNYFIYRDGTFSEEELNVASMVPTFNKKGEGVVWISIRSLILESLRRDNPLIFNTVFSGIEKEKIDGSLKKVPIIDRVLKNIPLCYKLKRTTDERKIRFMDRMNENSLTYSDLFVRYPLPKRIDEDALNIHQGRWQYPAFQRGFRYDSTLHLVREAVEKILFSWESVERMIYSGKKPSTDELCIVNAYTGEKEAHFCDMKTKDPVKLKV